MSITIKLKRGTQTAIDSYTGSAGELVYDTTNNSLRVHNGSKAGGYQLQNSDTTDGRYLRTSGGLMSGNIYKANNTNYMIVGGGIDWNYGGYIALFGKDNNDVDIAGGFEIMANNGTSSAKMRGFVDGTLLWNGKKVATEGDYLPITGGTLTGTLFAKTGGYINGIETDSYKYINMYGGANGTGGGFEAFAADSPNMAKCFLARSRGDNGEYYDMVGQKSGAQSWRSSQYMECDNNTPTGWLVNYNNSSYVGAELKTANGGRIIVRDSSSPGAPTSFSICCDGANWKDVLEAASSDHYLYWSGAGLRFRTAGSFNHNVNNSIHEVLIGSDSMNGNGVCGAFISLHQSDCPDAAGAQKIFTRNSDNSLGRSLDAYQDGNMFWGGTMFAFNFQITSDRRLKTNIKPIEDSLSKVNNLTGCTFNMNGVESEQGGLIAQDVEAVLPQAVLTNTEGYKTISYSAVVALLTNAVKQLSAEVADLKSQLQTVANQNKLSV